MSGEGTRRGTAGTLAAAAALAAWGALAAAYVARLDGRAQDDHYITYRYARNLAEGEGLVYNPGERVFGVSEPGLALLLAALHAAARVDVPHAATALYAAALVVLALVLLDEARRRGGSTLGALLGGTLLLASSAVWTNHGSAGALVLALLAIAARVAGERPGLAGALAGAAVWMRPDGAAGAALLGLLLTWERRRLPLRYTAAAGVVVLVGLAAAWAWFGTPLPETVAAKRADALARYGDGWQVAAAFWRQAADLAPRHFGESWRALVVVGLLGLIPLWRWNSPEAVAPGPRAGRFPGPRPDAASPFPGRAVRLLALHAGAVALAYSVLGVPFFSWYLLPVLAALLYGVGFAVAAAAAWIDGLARRSGSSRRRASLAVVVALLAAAPLLVPFGRAAWRWREGFSGYGHLETYRRAAEWLRRETPPDTSVAYVEIGVLGYDSRRPIVDLMGLVTRETRPYVAARDLAGAFLASPAEIVVFHTRGRMRPLLRRLWFQCAYAPVVRFDDRGGGGRLTLYRRLPGAAAAKPPRPSSCTPGGGGLRALTGSYRSSG